MVEQHVPRLGYSLKLSEKTLQFLSDRLSKSVKLRQERYDLHRFHNLMAPKNDARFIIFEAREFAGQTRAVESR